MRRVSLFAVLALLITGISLSSCKKENSTLHTNFTGDQTFSQDIFDDLTTMADEGIDQSSNRGISGGPVILSDCADVTLDLSVTPYLLTIDFGEENCLCGDNRYRRGKVLISFDGSYHDVGTTIMTTLEDYFVDDHEVTGTKIAINKGENTNGNLVFDVEEQGVIIKPDNEGRINWNSTRSREWIEGRETLNFLDDVYLISGNFNGSSIETTNGSNTSFTHPWNMDVVQPLRVALNCHWVTAGTMTINLDDLPQGLIDYGDGNCDNKASIEVGGTVYNFVMR